MGLIGTARRLLLQHVDADLRAGGAGCLVDHPGQAGELLLQLFLGVEAPVDGEPGRTRDGVEAGAGTGLSADDEHRARCLLAFDRKLRSLVEQLVGERHQGLGDADHVLEGVDALVDVADVRFEAGDLDS